MKAHIVHRMYANSNTADILTFSSAKKAIKEVSYVVDSAIAEGWTSSVEHNYMRGNKLQGVRITPPSGNMLNSELFFIYSQEIV
jgi:hypothetical protein